MPDHLYRLHAAAGTVHALSAVAGVSVIAAKLHDRANSFPVSNPVATYDRDTKQTSVHENRIGDWRALYVAPTLPLLSSLQHFYTLYNYESYTDKLSRNEAVPYKWAEYSASAGLMTVLVGVLSGIHDVKMLSTLFGMNVALQYTGYCVETDVGRSKRARLGAERVVWYESAKRFQMIGWLLFFLSFAMIWTAFFTSITSHNASEESAESVPAFVYAIIFIITAAYISFGAVSLAHTKGADPNRVRPRDKTQQRSWVIEDARRSEIAYTILSLASKNLLLWLVVGGSLDVSDDS